MSRTVQKIVLQAAAEGDVEQIQRIIHGERRYIALEPALIMACECGQTAVVAYLLRQRVALDANNGEALCVAAEHGYQRIVELLLQAGACVHAGTDYALRWSAIRGHEATVRLLVRNGADIHAMMDHALRGSAEAGHLGIVEFLVENGARVTSCDNDAVQSAVRKGHTDVVRFLLASGADTSCAVMCAIAYDCHDMLDRFIQGNLGSEVDIHTNTTRLLKIAAANNAVRCMRLLAQHIKHPSCLTSRKYIRAAARNGCLQMVRYLYLLGADITRIRTKKILNPEVVAYVNTKTWLHTEVSALARQAAMVYAGHYDLLPDPDSVPEKITEILLAAQA